MYDWLVLPTRLCTESRADSQIGYGSQSSDPHFLRLIQQVGSSLSVGNPGTPDLARSPWLRPAIGLLADLEVCLFERGQPRYARPQHDQFRNCRPCPNVAVPLFELKYIGKTQYLHFRNS